jgi:hypothetical protein
VTNQSRLEVAVPPGRQRIAVRLVNISRDGALIVSQNLPRLEPPIWLRIENPVMTDWAEAKIVRIGQDREIALHFPRRCPDDLLLAGTIGIDLSYMFLDGDRLASNCD